MGLGQASCNLLSKYDEVYNERIRDLVDRADQENQSVAKLTQLLNKLHRIKSESEGKSVDLSELEIEAFDDELFALGESLEHQPANWDKVTDTEIIELIATYDSIRITKQTTLPRITNEMQATMQMYMTIIESTRQMLQTWDKGIQHTIRRTQ